MENGNLVIDSGVKRVMINGDPNNVIAFNPTDVQFAEKFYQLMSEFDTKYEDYKKRAELIDANTEKDSHGIPKNLPDGIAMMREIGTFMRSKIDDLFGEGVSQKLFGDSINLNTISQFLEGITPYIKSARVEKVAKYAPTNAPPQIKRGRKARPMK